MKCNLTWTYFFICIAAALYIGTYLTWTHQSSISLQYFRFSVFYRYILARFNTPVEFTVPLFFCFFLFFYRYILARFKTTVEYIVPLFFRFLFTDKKDGQVPISFSFFIISFLPDLIFLRVHLLLRQSHLPPCLQYVWFLSVSRSRFRHSGISQSRGECMFMYTLGY